MSGSAVKSHDWPNKERRFCARRKISCFLSQDCRQAGLIEQLFENRSDEQTSGNRSDNPKSRNKNDKQAEENRFRALPEWLEEITDKCEDTQVPALANTSQDSDSDRRAKLVSRKHILKTNFPRDRNCEICLRTKMTRAPCRRRTGTVVPKAENVGDLMTADHKVLREGCEHHRYAVVVQDLATQWLDFGSACEELSWNHCTSTHHRSETKWDCWESGTQNSGMDVCCILSQSDLDEKWWADSMECYCYLRNVEDLLADENTPYAWKSPVIQWISSYLCEGQSRLRERNLEYASDVCWSRKFGKEILWLQTLKSW